MTTYTDEENQWNTLFHGTYAHKGIRLELSWEPDLAPISDSYTPDEITALDLLLAWVPQARKAHGNMVPIFWYISGDNNIFECAPLCASARASDNAIGCPPRKDFLFSYSRPLNARTGEPVNWARLPVAVGRWAPGEPMVVKADFISTATGWVPAGHHPVEGVQVAV